MTKRTHSTNLDDPAGQAILRATNMEFHGEVAYVDMALDDILGGIESVEETVASLRSQVEELYELWLGRNWKQEREDRKAWPREES